MCGSIEGADNEEPMAYAIHKFHIHVRYIHQG